MVTSSASVSTSLHDAVQTSESRNALVSQRGKSILGTFLYPRICPHAPYTLLAYVCLQYQGLCCRGAVIRFPVYPPYYGKKVHCLNFVPHDVREGRHRGLGGKTNTVVDADADTSVGTHSVTHADASYQSQKGQ